MREEIRNEKDWVSHMFAVLWTDRTTMNFSTEMLSFRMLYEYEAVLLIELNVSIWQILNWHTVRIRKKLIMMKTHQMKHQDKNIEEVKACMQCLKTAEKEHYNQVKNLVKQTFKEKDLIFLHNSKLKTSHSVKLKFHWNELYQVCKVIEEKSTYFLEKLNETSFRDNFHEN